MTHPTPTTPTLVATVLRGTTWTPLYADLCASCRREALVGREEARCG